MGQISGMPSSFKPISSEEELKKKKKLLIEGMPSSFKPITDEQPEQQGLAGQAWDVANKPFLNFNAGKDDALAYELSAPPSKMRGFLTGANQGANDFLSNLTSPLGLAALIGSEGTLPALRAGYPTVARGLSALSRTAAGLYAAHGAGQTFGSDKTLLERIMGIPEMAGGLAGLAQSPIYRARARLESERAAAPPNVEAVDLGNVKPEQKLLTDKRFRTGPEGAETTTDVNVHPPIRSREVPYRSRESFITAYGDTKKADAAWREYLRKRELQPEPQKLLTAGDETIRDSGSELDALDEFQNQRQQDIASQTQIHDKNLIPARQKSLTEKLTGIREEGPIHWGPESDTIPEVRPTALFKGWQQTGYEDMPDFPLYDVQGGESHGTTTDQQGLAKLGIDVPETPPNPHELPIRPATQEPTSEQSLDLRKPVEPEEPQFSRVLDFDKNRKQINEIRNETDNKLAYERFRYYEDQLAKDITNKLPSEQVNATAKLRDAARSHYYDLIGAKSEDINKTPRTSFGLSDRGDPLGEVKASINKVTYAKSLDGVVNDFKDELRIARATGDTRKIKDINEILAYVEHRRKQLTKEETHNLLLIGKDGKPINVGDTIKDFRGDEVKVTGISPPAHAGSSGRIHTDQGSFYPTVFDAKFEKSKPKLVTQEQKQQFEQSLTPTEEGAIDLANKGPEEPEFARRGPQRPRGYNPLRPDLGFGPVDIYDRGKSASKTLVEASENQYARARKLGIDPTQYKTSDELSQAIYEKRQELGLKPGEELEEPLKARSGKGGKVGVNIQHSAQEVTTGYSSPLEAVMVREGGQNAIDATRHLGKNGKIKVKIGNDYLEISDNGKGMSRNQIQKEFSDLYESGKGEEVEATGGKGIGKATYMLGGEHFKVITVKEIRGKKIKFEAEGTPEQLSKHFDIPYEVVPNDTPTGTTIRTKFKSDQKRYNAIDMIDKIMEFSRGMNQGITVNKYGTNEKEIGFKHHNIDDNVIHSGDVSGNGVTIAVPKKGELKDRSAIKVNYLNNGMYQFSKYHYLDKETPNMPANIIVDIRPTAKERSPEYPFPTQRESIKDDLNSQIEHLINERLAFPQQQAKQNKLRELYASMPEIFVGTKRKGMLFDPGERLTPGELRTLKSSPVIKESIKLFDEVIDRILEKVGDDKWKERLEGVGIVLDPDMHGVHIPNPDTGKSTILINPFPQIEGKIPEDAALGHIVTALHEVAHIGIESGLPDVEMIQEDANDPRIGQYMQEYLNQLSLHGGINIGHGIGFLHRMAQAFTKLGPEEAFSAADKLKTILTDESGGYNAEVQKLLQIYNESRGRDAVTEDLLSPTGERADTSRPGKKDTKRDAESDGARTLKGAVDKLLTAVEESKGSREQQEQIVRKEKAKRFAEFAGVKAGGMKGAARSLGKLAGQYEKVEAPNINLDMKETDLLFNGIKFGNITNAEKAQGYTALFGLINGGRLPTRSELSVLDNVFGGSFSERLEYMHGGLFGIQPHLIELGKLANTMKSMKSAIDYSAPFGTAGHFVHKKEFWSAYKKGIEFMRDPEIYKAAMAEIEKHPYYKLGRASGLFLNKPGSYLESEEAFLNSYVGQIPIAKQGVEISDRGYSGFLNQLRFDLFKRFIDEQRAAGEEPFTIVYHTDEETGEKTSEIVHTKLSEDTARVINNGTGRGTLGRAEKLAHELNIVLWSPRKLASRVQTLNPLYYASLDKNIRMEAYKSLLAVAGIGLAMNALGYYVLGGGLDPNPLSADFGKVRFGNKVMDPWAGHQQIVVAAARFITGMNEFTPQTRFDTIKNFATNKLSPFWAFMYDLSTAREFKLGESEPASLWPPVPAGYGAYVDRYSEKKYLSREFLRDFAPIFGEDTMDILNDDPKFASTLGMMLMSASGMGTQNYPERTGPRRPAPRRRRLSF